MTRCSSLNSSYLSRKVALVVVMLSAMLGTFAPAAAEVVLLRDGKSACRIVLEETASASEKHAAEELQSYFEASTGVKLPIVVGMPGGGGPMIVVGRGKIAASLGVDPSDEQLGEQGFVLRTVEPHLVIAGTARAGTLHGVRHFLEHVLGVRWYAPDVTKTPRHKNVVIDEDRPADPARLRLARDQLRLARRRRRVPRPPGVQRGRAAARTIRWASNTPSTARATPTSATSAPTSSSTHIPSISPRSTASGSARRRSSA